VTRAPESDDLGSLLNNIDFYIDHDALPDEKSDFNIEYDDVAYEERDETKYFSHQAEDDSAYVDEILNNQPNPVDPTSDTKPHPDSQDSTHLISAHLHDSATSSPRKSIDGTTATTTSVITANSENNTEEKGEVEASQVYETLSDTMTSEVASQQGAPTPPSRKPKAVAGTGFSQIDEKLSEAADSAEVEPRANDTSGGQSRLSQSRAKPTTSSEGLVNSNNNLQPQQRRVDSELTDIPANEKLRSGLIQAISAMKGNQSHFVHDGEIAADPEEAHALIEGANNINEISAFSTNPLREQERVQAFFSKKKPTPKSTAERKERERVVASDAAYDGSKSRACQQQQAERAKNDDQADFDFDDEKAPIADFVPHLISSSPAKAMNETEVANQLRMFDFLRVQDLNHIFEDSCSLWFCEKGASSLFVVVFILLLLLFVGWLVCCCCGCFDGLFF
jgi:hypothetical protein